MHQELAQRGPLRRDPVRWDQGAENISFGANPLRKAKCSPAEDKSLVPFCHKGHVCTVPGAHLLQEPSPANPSSPSPGGKGAEGTGHGRGRESCSPERCPGMPRAPGPHCPGPSLSAILCKVLRHPRDHTGTSRERGNGELRAKSDPFHPRPPKGWHPFKCPQREMRSFSVCWLFILVVSKLHPCNNKV